MKNSEIKKTLENKLIHDVLYGWLANVGRELTRDESAVIGELCEKMELTYEKLVKKIK